MSTNDAVFFRRNKQIEDAIDAQNLKQALQLIDKRIKKGENTAFLKAWKANILYRHADEPNRQRGIAETLALCKAEPPVTDLDTLDKLQETLKKMDGQGDIIRALWEKAAKAKPRHLELQKQWFADAFNEDDWKSAQKAAMSLQNNFPKNRRYYLWAIFLSYLVANDESSSEVERKLFGTLAYRMISKAAESVPSDPKELLSLPRAIQNAEELLLLIKIFESQGRHDEIVKILNSENLGIASRIIQNDWSFVGDKLSSLEKAGLWTEGLSYTKSLLAIPTNESERKALQERDDWAVWKLLVVSTQNINSQETTAESEKFINDFREAMPKSRNAQLARLDLKHSGVLGGTVKAEDLVSACQEYFDQHKNKLYCFGDLRSYLAALDKESLSNVLEYASKGQVENVKSDPYKGVATINALKLEYCFALSADGANVSKSQVEDFISRCLQVYRDVERPDRSSAPSTIESQASDDLCVIAAMSLMRFSGTSVSSGQEETPDIILIRAAAILERLLVDSPHNYQALLLLVRIYLRLGSGSLALKTFSKLSVKQMQFETVAHNLFTRLATIHPHSAPPIEGAEYKDFHPQSAFVQALNFYRTTEITTVRHRSNGLELGSYMNIEGTIELQRRLKNSICRRMWALDVRRMQRLVGGDPMGRHEQVARDTSPLIDQRMYDAFMNCEHPDQPTFEERMRLGPLPREQWVKSARITDQLFDMLKSMSIQRPVPVDTALPSLEDLVPSDASSEMTQSEIESVKVNLSLLKIVSYLNGSKFVTGEELDSCLTQVQEWLGSKSKDLTMDGAKVSPLVSNTAISLQPEAEASAPSWKTFHELYLVLESLKAVSLMTSAASKKGSKTAKIPKDRVEQLASSTRQVHESARANVRALKSRISESGVLGSMVNLVVAGTGHSEDGAQLRGELDKTLDMAALELFCGELMESWEEALEGLLKVSL
ncbi:N-acetyltransferase B complex non catalytic subunit-domain-containing protein [Aspergillus avenaceus]|uniref:N-acetyltransferase B complex non catalytic subunit-domain-containing protein n=1 Tax=Aspergillus avenaceus TaxID=36643 RepID=A0A5N6TQC7_ASPAV|nr:N-acetyltransferase B complex non catalytic subunit-domain-containing protein [Aspergillus avenaceus]